MDSHDYCRELWKHAQKKHKACLRSKGLKPSDVSATFTKIGRKKHFHVQAGKFNWQDAADCSWEAKAKAVMSLCGEED